MLVVGMVVASILLLSTIWKEWLETYHNVYSNNLQLQEKSFTQMSIWKARYPDLPLGVECTMSMLHVMLCDNELTTPEYKERDLQLLYSTSVMRFLNHLSVMSNCDSMYKMAHQQKIPDWLINLRHEAAHGNSLPALYLLRQASQVIMQWLKEHYWEAEAAVMEDFVINQQIKKDQDKVFIKELLDLWVELKINYWAGRKTIEKLSNVESRKMAMELAEEEGIGIKHSTNVSQKTARILADSFFCEVTEEADIDLQQQEYTHKIKTAFDPLVRRLFAPLRDKKHKKNRYQECLIQSIVGHPGFCPNINLDSLDESEWLLLMSLQSELWKEILTAVQAHSLMPQLLSALVAKESQLKFAHLWLSLFTQMYSGDPPPHPRGEERVCQLLAERLPFNVTSQVLHRRANKVHSGQGRQKGLELKPVSFKEIEILQDLAQKVLNNPTKVSSKYLYSLLSFLDTPLSSDTKEALCALAKVYSGQDLTETNASKVFSLASLLDCGLAINQPHTKSALPPKGDLEVMSPWKLFSGTADWSSCALGNLPW